MWGLFEGISFEAAQQIHAARLREMRRVEKEEQAHRRACDANWRLVPPKVATHHPGDCPSCGSQEFRRWQGVSVCSYCRSTAQTPRHTPSDTGLIAFGRNLTASRYAEYMHALARITTD